MQGEFEKSSSSFRGGIRSKCKKCIETSFKESTLSSMISRRAWLREKNYRHRSPAETARSFGHAGVATLIDNICLEVYSKDFIDLQISHLINRSLSSLNTNISTIRSLAPQVRATLIQKESFDDEADSANYALALVTQGSILSQYLDTQREIYDAPIVENDSSAEEAGRALSNVVDTILPVSIVETTIQHSENGLNSSAIVSNKPVAQVRLSAMKPVDISAWSESKAKTTVSEQKIFLGGSVEKDNRTSFVAEALKFKVQSKEEYARYPSTEKEYVVVSEQRSITIPEGESSEQIVAAMRRNSARDFYDTKSSQLLTSIKRSFSDSKIRFEGFMKNSNTKS